MTLGLGASDACTKARCVNSSEAILKHARARPAFSLDGRSALGGDLWNHHATSDRASRASTRTCRAPRPTQGPGARRVALWTGCRRPAPGRERVAPVATRAGHGARWRHRLWDPEAPEHPRSTCGGRAILCNFRGTPHARRSGSACISDRARSTTAPLTVVARAREIARSKLRNRRASGCVPARGMA